MLSFSDSAHEEDVREEVMNTSNVYDDKSKCQAGVEDDDDVNREVIETSDDPTNYQDGEYEDLEGKF